MNKNNARNFGGAIPLLFTLFFLCYLTLSFSSSPASNQELSPSASAIPTNTLRPTATPSPSPSPSYTTTPSPTRTTTFYPFPTPTQRLTLQPATEAPSPTAESLTACFQIAVANGVRIRQFPDTSASTVTIVPRGGQVIVEVASVPFQGGSLIWRKTLLPLGYSAGWPEWYTSCETSSYSPLARARTTPYGKEYNYIGSGHADHNNKLR